ncbi:MAG: tetratricopeptide repeat protein [Bradymonadaceae bacterium]|nr:tetratricopeptide repeat protein [Lujinxingiaceae bacterium]
MLNRFFWVFVFFTISACAAPPPDNPHTPTPGEESPTPSIDEPGLTVEFQIEPKDHYGQARQWLDHLDASIKFLEQRVEDQTSTWLDHADIARAYLTRARLTADWQDYRKSQRALERSFELTSPPAGPLLTRLRFHGAVHLFDRMTEDLQALEQRPITGQNPLAMESARAELDLQRGRTEEAMRRLSELVEKQPSATLASRLANLEFKTGNHAAASELYERSRTLALTENDLTRAWVELQEGIFDLERGRLDDALKKFQRADAIFSGWYLIEEHIAEVYARQGHFDRAIDLYRDILSRVPAGEFYDALADTLEDAGRDDEVEAVRKLALAAFENDLNAFPEAAYAHALEHFLIHGSTHFALELAQKNLENRPTPDAHLKWVQALVINGRLEDAHREIVATLQSTWDSAELHVTATVVFELTDNDALAATHRARAEALWPDFIDEFDWLAPR